MGLLSIFAGATFDPSAGVNRQYWQLTVDVSPLVLNARIDQRSFHGLKVRRVREKQPWRTTPLSLTIYAIITRSRRFTREFLSIVYVPDVNSSPYIKRPRKVFSSFNQRIAFEPSSNTSGCIKVSAYYSSFVERSCSRAVWRENLTASLAVHVGECIPKMVLRSESSVPGQTIQLISWINVDSWERSCSSSVVALASVRFENKREKKRGKRYLRK